MKFTRTRIGLFGLFAATAALAEADYLPRTRDDKPPRPKKPKPQPLPVRRPVAALVRHNGYPERSIEDVSERQVKQAAKLARRAARFAKERQP
jgi:hypothetical protein